MKARDELAKKEGIFLEPASAAPVAALSHLHDLMALMILWSASGRGVG